ncbi:thioredoxin domain-containing protein [Aquamicrobium segne]|uniref:Thioredoxin domain-containing protein n=1 Tax=Aquamicrobium segne TaxID=469547 RepID=A0ABW0GTP2_9HYPH
MTLPAHNLLFDEASPYLQQHANNPVHWRPWSSAALEEAQALDRPVLLSVGYAACHWCHVMAHESFENPEIAAVMNRLFVNIKVDREERPEIDQTYMAALTAMGDQGGWPLTMFLTPDARPFWGGTYFPPQSRFGRHGFVEVLEAVAGAWRNKRADILNSSDNLSRHIQEKLGSSHDKAAIEKNTLPDLAENIEQMIDRQAGGLKGAPKFPNAPFMQALWLSFLNTGNEKQRSSVIESLEHMLAGGIYDHIGGGLARYATDAEWLVPHFEKMLYDNAQLLRLANWAYAQSNSELFRIRIEETIGFLLREMRTEEGAFASSLDADSEGQEGLFYLWEKEDIEEVLKNDAPFFFAHHFLARPPAWEGKPILFQTRKQALAATDHLTELTPLKQRLLAAREKRIRPGRDDKILTDWNGLVISALAECGRSFGRCDWIKAAKQAFQHILTTAQDGRLPHSTLERRASYRTHKGRSNSLNEHRNYPKTDSTFWSDALGEKNQFPALSSDYGAMINAAISLFEATGEKTYIENAHHFIHQLDQWYSDDSKTGYYLSASDSLDVPVRIRGDVDEAIPSATAQIIEALTRLASLTGDPDLQQKAWTVAEYAAGRAARQSYGQIGIFTACELAREPHKLVMVEHPQNYSFVPVANRYPDPRRVDLVLPIGSQMDVSLPGNMAPVTDKAGAYLCTGQSCRPVITDPDLLESILKPVSRDLRTSFEIKTCIKTKA